MTDFGAELAGEREAALKFEQFPTRARAALRRRLDGITADLLARVVGAEPERTGRLRSETGRSVEERDAFVRGAVRVAAKDGREAAKAGALEYGASKPARVPSHPAHLTHVFGRQIAPIEVIVGAYSRPMHLIARRFLRGPLDAMRSDIIEQLRGALKEALD